MEETIGVPCEFVAIDNSDGSMGLCEVYNKGALKARYDLLCFAHEDILMRTANWGAIVVSLFDEHARLGLLGIAGGSYKPIIPSGWSYPTARASTVFAHYIQSRNDADGGSAGSFNNSGNTVLSDVVAVDGMWFCTRRKIAADIRFDESLFKRFHCYDVDFSLAVFQQYRVAVTFEILVEHFSNGSFNAEWAEETLKLHKKWKKHLPVNLAGLDVATQKSQEIGAYYFFLAIFRTSSIPVHRFLSVLWSKKLLSVTGYKTFIKLHLILLRERLSAPKYE